MYILHAHYHPPQTLDKTSGILFWMEISDLPAPKSGLRLLFCGASKPIRA